MCGTGVEQEIGSLRHVRLEMSIKYPSGYVEKEIGRTNLEFKGKI